MNYATIYIDPNGNRIPINHPLATIGVVLEKAKLERSVYKVEVPGSTPYATVTTLEAAREMRERARMAGLRCQIVRHPPEPPRCFGHPEVVVQIGDPYESDRFAGDVL